MEMPSAHLRAQWAACVCVWQDVECSDCSLKAQYTQKPLTPLTSCCRDTRRVRTVTDLLVTLSRLTGTTASEHNPCANT